MDSQTFETFMRVVQTRRSCRNLKADPLPEGAIEKILEAGRWAMSGNNGQPWEFIVVTKPEVKKALWAAYQQMHREYVFWMEQMRTPELRHPAFQRPGTPEEQLAADEKLKGWAHAPALIVVCGDGRKQWSTVMAAFTFGRHSTHLTDGLANACQIMHLAARAMGLGSMWVTIHVQEEFKRILKVPDLVMIHSIIPIGYAHAEPRMGSRQPLAEKVHYDSYDMDKYRTTRQVLEDLANRRARALQVYRKTEE